MLSDTDMHLTKEKPFLISQKRFFQRTEREANPRSSISAYMISRVIIKTAFLFKDWTKAVLLLIFEKYSSSNKIRKTILYVVKCRTTLYLQAPSDDAEQQYHYEHIRKMSPK